jgi:hypothetical protein
MQKVAQKLHSFTTVIFKPLPKANNRPIGENSPNLVTLLGGRAEKFHQSKKKP